MDRNREARRASIVGSNGFNRRRHRTNSLRDSPEEDGGLESQESVRLRERVKKDRDRERERDRDRERDLRERSSRSKRRRAEKLTSGGDETSEESVNDEEYDEDEEFAGSSAAAAGVRFSSPAMGSLSNHHHQNHHVHGGNHHHHHSHSSSISQQQPQHNSNSITSSIINNNNHHLQHRKTFPPSSSSSLAKVVRAPPPVWKPGDEMISASVPRKARSASTKRSHDWISNSSTNNSGGGDQNPALPSSSPAWQSHVSTPAAPPPAEAPTSPSSSTASIRKKLKHSVNNNNSGPKLKPPKASSSSAKPSTLNPEELEIEIAEVLYGLMTQSQAPPPSKKDESKEANRFNIDPKSLNSSPISSSIMNNNPILGPNSGPLSAVAPKRKRPRQVPESPSLSIGARSSPISAKPDTDQTPKSELSSPNLEKISGSAAAENESEMGGISVTSQVHSAEPPLPTAPESMKSDSDLLKKHSAAELKGNRDLIAKEDVSSSKEQELPVVRDHDSNNRDSHSKATASSAATTVKTNSIVPETENQKEEKFEIDLMAPPPQARSSPERETRIDLSASFVVEQKPVLPIVVADLKPVVASNDNVVEKGKMSGTENEHLTNLAAEEKKNEDEEESNKATIENNNNNTNNKVSCRNIDLRLDLENPDRDVGSSVIAVVNENKSPMQFITQKQQQLLESRKEEPPTEKPGISASSMPFPMSMASWPGGLPPMGYMAPLQGVISVDGGGVAPAHAQQPIFSQPRPKRCATHCHIARNIHCLQQFMKMNPFWPPPTGSPVSLFTSKSCNLKVVPPADLNIAAGGANNNNTSNTAQGNVPSLDTIPSSNGGKGKSSSSESTQRKQQQQQILIQQALPPVPPSSLLGPAFIFPLNQQQQAAVAALPGLAASSPTTVSSSNTSTSAAISSTSVPLPGPMSFNYPNMTPNETQYLAILQNNAYPFPIPSLGAPQNYRAPQAQSMPLFNGSFYPSQIIHQQLQQSSSQQPQLMQAYQNATAANNSSSSAQKQQHNQSQQQQRPQSNNFPSQKGQPSQHNQHVQQGNEESPLANDNRGSRASVNIYGQNFALPIHPQNFAMMTPQAVMTTAHNGNQAEKKSNQQHQQQQPVLKTGVIDSLPPHTFAMSFGPGIDASSMAQSQSAMFQNCPEGTRQNIQMMAAAAVAAQAAQKNSLRISEEGKSGNSDHSGKEERKSFAFSRSDLADAHVTSSIQPNNVIESSGRSITAGPGPARSSRPATTSGMGVNVVPNAHIQAKLQQQLQKQQQQMMQQLKHQQQQHQHQQQMAANAVNRANKQPVTSNGTMYSEHLNSSSVMAAKLQSTISPFPQNLVPSNSPSPSPSQSPQWKSSTRTPAAAAQPGPSSLGSSGPLMHKTNNHLPQQHSRNQPPMHAQISFGGNNQHKQSLGPQGQASPIPSSNNQVSSPTTSSMSKGTSGSPRTNSSASTNNKVGPGPHGPSFPAQTNKNLPSILGNPHVSKSQSQMQRQQAQQKNMQQQAQLFFSNPYAQPTQSLHSTTTSSTSGGPTGYHMPQRRPDQHQRGSAAAAFTSSSGVLSLCTPASLSGTSTNDPATAIAAATCNVKVPASPFGAQPTGTLLPAGFSYVHPVPAGVQVKPAEQKQPAGNDNVHHQWQPEKK